MIDPRFLADYFGFVLRLVAWFVILIFALLLAYVLVLVAGESFKYVNANWVEADEGTNYLIVICVVVFIVGIYSSWTWRRRRW